MPVEKVDGVPVDVKGDKSWAMDYRASDMEQLYKDASPHSWQDLIRYLETHGDNEWHITPGEAVSMKQDLEHVVKGNVPFTPDASKAYNEVHKYRSQDQQHEPKIAREMNH